MKGKRARENIERKREEDERRRQHLITQKEVRNTTGGSGRLIHYVCVNSFRMRSCVCVRSSVRRR